MRILATIEFLLIAALTVGAQTKPAPKRPAAPSKSASPSASAPSKSVPLKVAGQQCPIPRNELQQVYRLYMKDGSLQPVTECELLDAGQRVHYKSAERGEWEDVPSSLVDWPATQKVAKEGPGEKPAEASADAAAADAEEEAERKAEESKSPQIHPGLRLPEQGGVFVLDYWRDEPQLVELMQNGSDINKNTGRNILRAAINPIAKAKQTIEIKGQHARVQAHVPQPALYVNVDMDQDPKTGPGANDLSQHFRIVKVDEKKDSRVVGAIEIAVYGKVSQKANYVETHATPVSGDWIKVTPVQPLEPGEYALVEMLGKDVNLYVWDFGVHPGAPQNPKAWRPAPVTDTTTGTKESPVLNQRPKE
jgi:hypothetical protein